MRRNNNLWLLGLTVVLTMGLTSCFKDNGNTPNYLNLKTMFGKYKGSIYIVEAKAPIQAKGNEETNFVPLKAPEKGVVKEYKDMKMEIDRTITIRDFPLAPIINAIFIKQDKENNSNTQHEKKTFTFETTYGYIPGFNFINVIVNPVPVRFNLLIGEKEEEVTAIIEGIRTNPYLGAFFYPEQVYRMGLVARDIKVSGKPISGRIKYFYYLKFKKETKAEKPQKE